MHFASQRAFVRDQPRHAKPPLPLQYPQFDKIRDSDFGPGFDLKEIPDPTDPANILKESGRGLLFMRAFMDEVRKYLDGKHIPYQYLDGATSMQERKRRVDAFQHFGHRITVLCDGVFDF